MSLRNLFSKNTIRFHHSQFKVYFEKKVQAENEIKFLQN